MKTKIILLVALTLGIFITSCSEKKPKAEIDFLPKTTPFGIWTTNTAEKERIAKLITPMKDLEGATDDKKDKNDYLILQEDLNFIAHNKKAFFVLNTQNMTNEDNKNQWAGILFGDFTDNHFNGNFYNFDKSIGSSGVKITTPIDNYELIDKKSRFRFIYKNMEYKGSMLPAQNVAFYDIFTKKPASTNCKLHSQIKRDGADFNNISLDFAQADKIALSATGNCELSINLTPTYKDAGEIVEFSASASLNSCNSTYKEIEGSYSGLGFSLEKKSGVGLSTTTNKLVLALLGANRPILLNCTF